MVSRRVAGGPQKRSPSPGEAGGDAAEAWRGSWLAARAGRARAPMRAKLNILVYVVKTGGNTERESLQQVTGWWEDGGKGRSPSRNTTRKEGTRFYTTRGLEGQAARRTKVGSLWRRLLLT